MGPGLAARLCVEGTVLHCLGYVPGLDARLTGEVRESPRDP